jgi:Rieske 2Fe-2S family protein
VNAFYNTCRHRASRICEANAGNTKSFVCPYHGWVYNLDGSLHAAREMDARESFGHADYGLKSPQLTVFHGLIFINCDEGADSFEPELAIVESPLGMLCMRVT